jgi:hypothetical protein
METPMSQPVHPGTIVYVDGITHEEERRPVGDVPESMRFRPTPHGMVPVVKVVRYVDGDKRYIREYGPGDELLVSTMGRA